ncbi:MAG TPA: hypothetical protein PLV50_04385 [Smithella sp.]|nr:hypothetical protein [Smithella sp.]MDM7987990.1 hypothetical protein [Smithella sp.]HNY49994.1 hypothetical protein [Smithella sp.]HOG89751.1 hypothetical protein [Smithella sp.]HOU50092.1 hypothetical protein [Smithella sp.]
MKRALVKFNIATCVFLLANLWGCGVKSNPVVLKNYSGNLQVGRNLKVTASNHTELLKWNIHADDLKHDYFTMRKSTLDSRGNDCKDCPKSL